MEQVRIGSTRIRDQVTLPATRLASQALDFGEKAEASKLGNNQICPDIYIDFGKGVIWSPPLTGRW